MGYSTQNFKNVQIYLISIFSHDFTIYGLAMLSQCLVAYAGADFTCDIKHPLKKYNSEQLPNTHSFLILTGIIVMGNCQCYCLVV